MQFMDELGARNIVLVRAIETADADGRILSDDDRHYASRSANELAQWDAADKKSATLPEIFLQKRAEQLLKKIEERTPAFSRLVKTGGWLRTIALALPVLALLAGAAADRIGDPHRVDLLSVPLLLIVLWNLAVYVGLLVWRLLPASRTRRADSGFLGRLMTANAPAPRKLPSPLVAALASFNSEWLRMSAPLTTLRVKRAIHLSAACFAIGAVISLYLRGMVSQYRAGWESTFLDAGQVHAILSALFMPATAVFRLPQFSIAEIRALEFSQATSASGGALWVHLYAGTLVLLVVLPRILLALAAGWRERRLAARFPLDLNQPYFRKLTSKIGPAVTAVLRVFPYSFSLDEGRDRNLTVVAHLLLGEHARVMLRPATPYGEELADGAGQTAADPADIAMTVALFNLSATPERESHGAFLAHLQRLSSAGCAVLIDESAYLERIGAQSGGDDRLRERVGLWRQFCEAHHVAAAIVNLLDPQARAAELANGLSSGSTFTSRP